MNDRRRDLTTGRVRLDGQEARLARHGAHAFPGREDARDPALQVRAGRRGAAEA
jgi:hypothetical protein